MLTENKIINTPTKKKDDQIAFYFCINAKNNMYTNPINTPAILLEQESIITASFSIPCHDEDDFSRAPLNKFLSKMHENHRYLDEYLDNTTEQILEMTKTIPNVHLIGLSRGCLIATHLAKRIQKNNPSTSLKLLCYAPLISFLDVKGCSKLSNLAQYDLMNVLPNISQKIYVGHHDTRINTNRVIQYASQLSNTSLTIYPSIGFHGHGTPHNIFSSGINWLLEDL